MVRGCIIIIILFPGKTEPKGYGLYGVFVGGGSMTAIICARGREEGVGEGRQKNRGFAKNRTPLCEGG